MRMIAVVLVLAAGCATAPIEVALPGFGDALNDEQDAQSAITIGTGWTVSAALAVVPGVLTFGALLMGAGVSALSWWQTGGFAHYLLIPVPFFLVGAWVALTFPIVMGLGGVLLTSFGRARHREARQGAPRHEAPTTSSDPFPRASAPAPRRAAPVDDAALLTDPWEDEVVACIETGKNRDECEVIVGVPPSHSRVAPVAPSPNPDLD